MRRLLAVAVALTGIACRAPNPDATAECIAHPNRLACVYPPPDDAPDAAVPVDLGAPPDLFVPHDSSNFWPCDLHGNSTCLDWPRWLCCVPDAPVDCTGKQCGGRFTGSYSCGDCKAGQTCTLGGECWCFHHEGYDGGYGNYGPCR